MRALDTLRTARFVFIDCLLLRIKDLFCTFLAVRRFYLASPQNRSSIFPMNKFASTSNTLISVIVGDFSLATQINQRHLIPSSFRNHSSNDNIQNLITITVQIMANLNYRYV